MDKEKLHESISENTVLSFARSGGKGGQNVNKVNTKVHAVIPLSKISGLTEKEFNVMAVRLKSSINKEMELFLDAEDSRSQEQNRRIALERLESKIISAARLNKKRIKTKPSVASNEKRLKIKKIRSALKRQRNSGFDF